jgi:hypothetical protein
MTMHVELPDRTHPARLKPRGSRTGGINLGAKAGACVTGTDVGYVDFIWGFADKTGVSEFGNGMAVGATVGPTADADLVAGLGVSVELGEWSGLALAEGATCDISATGGACPLIPSTGLGNLRGATLSVGVEGDVGACTGGDVAINVSGSLSCAGAASNPNYFLTSGTCAQAKSIPSMAHSCAGVEWPLRSLGELRASPTRS